MSLAVVDSFAPSQSAYSSSSSSSSSRGSFLSGATESSAGRGFGNSVAEKPQKPVLMSVQQVKDQLLELLPRMTGTEDEFRAVEKYVNILEDKYAPPQTLDFLNLAMGGEWQLLFSTTLKGGPRPNFRLKELVQTLLPNGLDGTVTNMAQWDLDDDDDGVFDCSGTFSAVCEYEINQGARMIMELKDHKIELLPGSAVPKDVQGLVGLIHRIMPTELFDPNDHAVDTTYLDGDLRIVRMTGPSYEGVRDIFIRVGSMEINPVAAADDQ
jgi:hypothetical protein